MFSCHFEGCERAADWRMTWARPDGLFYIAACAEHKDAMRTRALAERPMAAAEFSLAGQTPAEIRAAALERERQQAEERAKERAPGAAEFALTGSDRAADKARARGQRELF